MTETVFTKVDYDLGSLVKYIGLGEIGLPDIQRPFVWKNAKVRDLFDSMYKGYPVGYLLFWQNGLAADHRTIGIDDKQKPPRLVIVDGQQRLTSLYAVVNGISVVRDNYDSENIQWGQARRSQTDFRIHQPYCAQFGNGKNDFISHS